MHIRSGFLVNILVVIGYLAGPSLCNGLQVTPSPYWKARISFPDDAFCSFVTAGSRWIKFTILLGPYDANVVYFQNSKKYKLHYDFAVNCLDPFLGISWQDFYAQTVLSENPKAILGTVLYPPTRGSPPVADFNEYGIQFVRYDRDHIARFFHLVKASVDAPLGVQAFFMPTFEQQAQAQADRGWFESQGIRIGSMTRWATGNVCYSEGWALGTLKYCQSAMIRSAYLSGQLEPNDILLTDGVPAEIPLVAGVITLSPSTPNSHVAILSKTYGLPFVYLAVQKDADLARSLVGRKVILTTYEDAAGLCQTRLIDVDGSLDQQTIQQILGLRNIEPLQITPMEGLGRFVVSTDGLSASDVRYVGGKAANFGLLRRVIPQNSPKALAITFDLWTRFLDQTLPRVPRIELGPREYILIWADGDPKQGPTHASFKLSASGELVALFDRDGSTLLDVVQFSRQAPDVSFGRIADGAEQWALLSRPTPGASNGQGLQGPFGLVINEIMADNRSVIQDPCESGEFPDWIELYNGSDQPVVLNGLYLTDNINEPTKWQIPVEVVGPTLLDEIYRRLSGFDRYPPADLPGLMGQLATIRRLFTNDQITDFDPDIRAELLAGLTDPQTGFDPGMMLRFRSSTNVEDSQEYTGAGLYDSFSGCPADDLDHDDQGACRCDPNERSERGVFRAIRRTFASFYNENAYLERIRRSVDESKVGMAMLVNPAFPDQIELANGVATVDINNTTGQIHLVTQLGATSVTNPEGGSIPEEIILRVLAGWSLKQPVPADIKQTSSLVPLGGTVMTFPADYRELGNYLLTAAKAFANESGKSRFVLDLEYKKVAPGDKTLPNGGIVIKQVREVPQLDQQITPFLIDQPLEFEIFTGECQLLQDTTDVFAVHRLKSRWYLSTKNMRMDPDNLSNGIYRQICIEYLSGQKICSTELGPTEIAEHLFTGRATTDKWQIADRTYQLTTTGLRTSVSGSENPIFTLSDLGTLGYTPYLLLTLDVQYGRPVAAWHQSRWPSSLRYVSSNRVYLWQVEPPDGNDVFQERVLTSGGVAIMTSFYYPRLPRGYITWAGSTAPVKRWDKTIIEGLTSRPIVLKGYYCQTYMPEHHNLIENFLFEPALEQGIDPDLLAELQAKGIRLIHMLIDRDGKAPDQSMITTYGYDLQF